MARQTKVEIFSAGCPLCEETVNLVRSLAHPGCDVVVYNLNETGMDKATGYGITSVPTVVVDGCVLEGRPRQKLTEEDLAAAGIVKPL